MPVVDPRLPLRADQRAMPLVWILRTDFVAQPVADAVLDVAAGSKGYKRVLRSWGHDERTVHWLMTRCGTNLHTDTAYLRYSHHLIIRNDGWRIIGADMEQWPRLLTPGTIYCLDTHSPHQVVPDPRIAKGRPLYKLQVALDASEVLDPGAVRRLLSDFASAYDPAESAATAHSGAPKPAALAARSVLSQ